MKKVFKKFNRTLSIMLAAAMVLTMAPQTAMPVLAEEPEITSEITEEPQASEVVEDENSTTEEASDAEVKEEESTDVGEIKNPENSGVSDPSGDEQIDEEDDKTSVIDQEENSEITDATETDETETNVSNESEDLEEPEAGDGQGEENSEIMSVTPSDAVISFDSKSGGEDETAGIAYVGGCVDDSQKLATGKDLRFRIKLNNGRKLTKVEAKIGEATNPKTLTKADANADTIYEVAWDEIEKTVDGVEVGQPVQIVVTTEAQTYNITFTGNHAKIYPVVAIPADEGAASKGNMPGTTEATTVADAAYDTAVTYVVKADEGYKLEDAKVGDTPVTIGTTDLYENATAAEQTKFDTITITPSDYKKAWDSDAFTVTVNAVPKAVMTAKFTENENVEFFDGTSTDADAIKYDATNKEFAPVVEGGLKDTSKLSFGVKANNNYVVKDVTAVAKTAAQEDGTTIPETDIVKGEAAADGVIPYTISLASLKAFTEDTTVSITVNTEYEGKYKDANVHEVTFAGDLDKATVTTGDAGEELPENNTVTVITDETETELQIQVAPNRGYELPKRGGEGEDKDDRVISVTKQVKYETDTAGTYGTAVEQTDELVVDEYDTATLQLVGEDNNYEGGDAEGAKAKKFTVVSATVTIDTIYKENGDDKQLYVINALGEDAEYSVQYAEEDDEFKDAALDETLSEDKDATDEEMDNTWYIPKAAERVKVVVTTEKTPVAELDDQSLTAEPGESYQYVFPAANLSAAAYGGSRLTISEAVQEDEFAVVKVKVDTRDVTITKYTVDGVTYDTTSDVDEDGYYTLRDAIVGKGLSMTFAQVDGATLKSISYKMGEEEAKTVAADNGRAELEIEEVTGDVTVDVVSESAYVVKLYDGSKELSKDRNGVYEADYKTTGIEIRLYKTAENRNNVDFYDVVVKDEAATAETEATIAPGGKYATLGEIYESERGKTLTIQVYKKGEEKPFEAKLRTNAASSEVKVTRVVKGKTTEVKKDESVKINNDASMTFTVTSVGASVSDLDVKLFKKDGTAALSADEQKWFEDNGAVSLNNDGTFTIKTTPAASTVERGEVEVRIYNKNEAVKTGETEKALDGAGSFKLKVEGYMINDEVQKVTAKPGNANNTTVRINLDTVFNDKNNLPKDPNTGDLYYKVVLGEIDGDVSKLPGITKLTGAELTKYVKLDASDYASPAKTVPIKLVKDERADKTNDINVTLSTTIEEVSLVQSLGKDLENATSVAEEDCVPGPKAEISDKDKVLSTKEPRYETKLSVKTENKATVITGQEDVKIATPVFSANTGYDSLNVQFVDTKTGVELSEEGSSTDFELDAGDYSGYFRAWVAEDNSIHVSADHDVIASNIQCKSLGVKVIADYPKTAIGFGYAASAVVKLNVKQGIFSIEADESKGKLPETIYQNGGKNATLKISTRLNEGNKSYKPAKASLDWVIDYDEQSPNIQKNLSMVNSKGKAAPTISVKNGTLTVTKDYEFSRDGSEDIVTVTAKAADFSGNPRNKEFAFIITDTPDALATDSLVIVDQQGNVKNASALKAEDFDQTLYVAALRNGVKKGQSSYSARSDFMPVTIKTGSKANLEIGLSDRYNRATLIFKKSGKNLKISVNTVDGGNKKATLLVNIDPYKELGLYLEGADGSNYTPDDTNSVTYKGGSNQMYTLRLAHKDSNGSWQYNGSYKNVKVKVENGKFIANKNWAKNSDDDILGTAVIASKNGKAKITVTDAAVKNDKGTVYNITNTGETATKAPSIKLYSPKKISNESLWNEENGDYDPIVYQVTDKNNGNYAGQYVKVAPDYTVANNMAEELDEEYDYDESEYVKDGIITIAKIDENGRFKMPIKWLRAGSYKMVATVCERKQGDYVPLAKDVKLNFSIKGTKAPSTAMSVTAKYTLDAKSNRKVNLAVKTDTRYIVSDVKNVIKEDTVLAEITKDTHTNEFTRYFEVKESVTDYYGPTGYTIGLKDDLTAADIQYITGQREDPKEIAKAKEDCTGYITVSNGYYGYDEWGDMVFRSYNTKDIKVTISFIKENKRKYSAKAGSVFAPKENQTVPAYVSVMNGKDSVTVVAAKLEDDGGFAEENSVKAVRNAVEITSKASVQKGTYNVKLKVVPLESGFIADAKWNETANKWDLTYVSKDRTPNSQLTEEELFNLCGVDVTARVEVKATGVAKVIKIDKKALKVVLNAEDYKQGSAGKMGEYVTWVPYGFLAENMDIATTNGVVLGQNKDKETLNNIAGGDLFKLAVKDGNNWIEEDGQRYIRIAVDKNVLQSQYEQAEKNKSLPKNQRVTIAANYGAKVKVPVVFTYDNNGDKTETITFELTMPKKPLSFEEIKDILNGDKDLGSGKAKRNIRKEIESIKTPQSDRSNVILNGLLWKVWDKANSVIPQDADVALTPDLSEFEWWDEYETGITKAVLNAGTDPGSESANDEAEYDTIMNDGAAKINLTISNKLATGADATVKLPYNFDENALGVKHTITSDGSEIAYEIADEIQRYFDNDFIPTNDMTEEKLLTDIWELEGVKKYSNRDSISIWFEDWKLTPATERKAGYFSVTARVNDYSASVEMSISRISNIGDVESVLSETFTSEQISDIVIECGSDEAKIKERILTVAKAAIGNSNLDVAYAQIEKTAATDTTPAVMEDDFTYTVKGRDVALQFRLLITSKTTGRTVEYTSEKFAFALNHKQQLDQLIFTYIDHASDAAGITRADYDKETNAFTVVIGDENVKVVDAFVDWANDKDADDALKADVIKKLKAAFGTEWDAVESFTLNAKVRVFGETKSRSKTIEKKEGERIEEFANRLHDEMKDNQQYYIDRINEELEKREIDNFTYGWLMTNKVSGTLDATVNYADGGSESQIYTVKLAK